MSEEVIELSVEETNKLRMELGLRPLRTEGAGDNTPVVGTTSRGIIREGEEALLELSVDATNKLREKLGLPPLRSGGGGNASGGNWVKEISHQSQTSEEKKEAIERIDKARLQREVQEGVNRVFELSTLTSNEANNGDGQILSWAESMRRQKNGPSRMASTSTKIEKRGIGSSEHDQEYGAQDLEGIQVRNSMGDLETGSSTILTLADTAILETKTSLSKKVVGLNEKEDFLENVSLSEKEKQKYGLRKKRLLEMGMGRAGGYAGFDDEEFEELGGTLGPSRRDRSGTFQNEDGDETEKFRGFRIGSEKDASTFVSMSDFEKVQQRKSVSLIGKSDVTASDYMTIEEEKGEREKRRYKTTKFRKKNKKKDTKQRRKTVAEYDADFENEASAATTIPGNNLLAQLDQGAFSEESGRVRKRSHISDANEFDGTNELRGVLEGEGVDSVAKRAKFDEIMEKGNQRTKLAFGDVKPVRKSDNMISTEEEADDSFLNAALAKARRLNRLRSMNNTNSSRGADAVVKAMQTTQVEKGTNGSSGLISFSIEDTHEFSRALRAREEQKERETKKIKHDLSTYQMDSSASKEVQGKRVKVEHIDDDMDEDVVDMEEVVKEIATDDTEFAGLGGTKSGSAGVGRGLSSFVSMLKTTGEITGRHGGKEELRGRAKDERNYDNYEPLDLKKVVAIGRNATDKDKEFANREIKLEYRDKHGRLLTQKEAFRDLCYQFHGHGASKKKEEKRLQQNAREQAEGRLASRQISAARDGTTAGTLGALKATQKATGKAFIVHKT